MNRYLYLAASILFTLLALREIAKAADTQNYTFHYSERELKITTYAETKCEAYRKAAKMCYNILTGGSSDKPGAYPGEEQGLHIIDVCSNPTNYKLK